MREPPDALILRQPRHEDGYWHVDYDGGSYVEISDLLIRHERAAVRATHPKAVAAIEEAIRWGIG